MSIALVFTLFARFSELCTGIPVIHCQPSHYAWFRSDYQHDAVSVVLLSIHALASFKASSCWIYPSLQKDRNFFLICAHVGKFHLVSSSVFTLYLYLVPFSYF